MKKIIMSWNILQNREHQTVYVEVCWKYGDSAEILNYEEFE